MEWNKVVNGSNVPTWLLSHDWPVCIPRKCFEGSKLLVLSHFSRHRDAVAMQRPISPRCSFSSWWRHQWKHFLRYWPFVRGIHRSPVNSPHKGQWRGALMFSSICVWINGWVNSRQAGHLRRYRAHYDVSVMWNSRSARDVRHWVFGCSKFNIVCMRLCELRQVFFGPLWLRPNIF